MKKASRNGLVISFSVIAALTAAAIFPFMAKAHSASHVHPTRPAMRQMQRVGVFVGEGNKAMADGDLYAAERAYKQAIAADPADHSLSIYLARLFDVQGRDQESLEAYDRVMHPYRGSSSYQTDPRALARYGDLLVRYGDPSKAVLAYQIALREGARTSPKGATLAKLSSLAHTVAGMRAITQADEKNAAKEMNLAVKADPMAWDAQYYLGVAQSATGRKIEGAASLAKAEKLAPPNELKALRHFRAMRGLGNNATMAVIEIKGKNATLREVPREQ